MRQHRVAFGCEVTRSGKLENVWNNALMFQTLTVGHDDVRISNAGRVRYESVDPNRVRVNSRSHHRTRRTIADDGTALFQLDHARKQLRRRCRLAIDQYKELAGERLVSPRLRDHFFFFLASLQLAQLYVMVNDVADQCQERFLVTTTVSTEVKYESLMFLDFLDRVSNLNRLLIKAGHFPDENITLLSITLAIKMGLLFFFANQISCVVTLTLRGEIHDLLSFLHFRRDVELPLLTVRLDQRESHTGPRANLIVEIKNLPLIVPRGFQPINRDDLVAFL